MDDNLIQPTVNTGAAAPAVADITVAPAPVVNPQPTYPEPATPQPAAPQPMAPIGFTAPAQAAPVTPLAIPQPAVLPVMETAPAPALPAAEVFSAQLETPAAAPVRAARKPGVTWKLAATASLFMVLIVGATLLFGRGQEVPTSNSQANGAVGGTIIPEQDLSLDLPVEPVSSISLQGSENALVVNGDLITTGALKLYNGEYFTNFVQGTITADRTITLPDADGVLCLDSNNCNFATAADVAGLQTNLTVTATQAANAVPRVANFNGRTGNVTLTGSGNITITDQGDGVFNISGGGGAGASGTVALGPTTTQQDTSTNPAINITKTGSGNLLQLSTGVPASPVQRFVVDQTGAITVGTIDFSRVTNKPALVNSIDGVQGAVTLGTGLDMSGQSLLNTGVTSLNGETGGVSLFAGTGIGITGTTISNLGVTQIIGTANQITAVPSSGVVNLSLPQDIAVTSTPTFAAVTVNGTLNATTVSTDGTVRITSTGALQNVTSATAGTFFTGGTLPVGRGGTGAVSFISNGILYGNGTGAIQATAAGTTGQCLVATTGAAPSWVSCLTAAEGSAPGGGAGGDLTGSYPNPTIAKLQGQDLIITGGTLDAGQFLMFDGDAWVNQGLVGDITVADDGFVSIDDNAITTTKLANNNVTNEKLAFDSVTVTAGTGLTGGGEVALGANTSLAVAYGSSAGTAVQGNTTLTVTAGTNLSGGGTVTLGTGGSVTVNTVNNPTFSTSVTTPMIQGATSLTINTLATAGADDIILSAAGAEIGRFLENGDYRFEKGTFDLTLSTSSISGSNKTITLPNETGTICTTGSVCAGYAAAAGSNNYVQLQDDTPGTPQNGHFNISGTGIAASFDADEIKTGGVTRLTAAGVLQDVTNADAGTFFTGGILGTARGGTGLATFTQYGVVFGNGTGALGVTVAGTSSQCLVGNTGAAPSWIDCDVASAGAEPGGDAGGDLAGTYPNPTLAKLQGTDLLINSPVAGHTLVYNATNSRWDNVAISGDVSIGETGVATIAANSVALGTDTNGNYVASLGTLTGLSVTGNTGEGSTPALSVLYGSTANTAVQGNTSITITAGDNINGGGSITLGAGGTVTLDLDANPSLTSLTLSSALGVASGGTGASTFTSKGILFGNGASAIGVTAAGLNGQCLVGNTGGNPSWADCDAAAGGSTPGGDAGGDLSGSYPNPQIAKLQGTTLTIGSLSGGQILVYDATNDIWKNATVSGDLAINENGAATIAGNAVALGTDTTGNYVATLGTLTGLSVTGNTGEGSTPALSVTYGSSANTAVQGNTTITVSPGTNLSGGGTITLGSGGSVTLNTADDVSFNSATLSTALGVASGGTGATSLTTGGILFGNGTGAITTSGVLTNGQLLIGDGAGAPTVATLTGGTGVQITNGAGSITVAVDSTVCTTAGVCSGYAPASGSNNYVNIQGSTPGTPQTGNFNLSGTGIIGTLNATTIQTNDTTRLTAAGVLQNVTNADAASFFTGGSLTVARGGTGLGSVTNNGIIYGNGTGALGVTTAGATGQCLVGNTGGAPSWSDCTAEAGGSTPGGPAGGDLSGTYPNPTIGKLQGTNLLINSPTGGHMLIYNASNTRWENVAISTDLTISETGVATIAANSVTLGTDTTGGYVGGIGTLTGLSTTGNSGEGSTPTLSVLYGSTANTSVQGNVTVVCPTGSGNLTGGSNTITLGTGGTCSAITTNDAVTFATSVTSPIFQGSGAMTLKTLATGSADDIVFSTANTEVARLLENGTLVFGPNGSQDANIFRGGLETLATTSSFNINTATDSATGFLVQNAADETILVADTVTGQVAVGIASGGKFINVPGGVTLNSAIALPGTSTNASTTAYANQKKIVTLSQGTTWVVENYTAAASGEFFYKHSNEGSFTYVGSASISGWTNGSIDAYVDSGGTERIIATYNKGSEAASGARTYVRVGTLNPARTTITWGSETLVGGANANSYPDVVALAEGTGGVAWIAVSYGSGGSDSGAYTYRMDIDASGAIAANGSAVTIGQWNSTSASFPSIDYDPSTKRLFVTASAGATGSGKGIRFRTASYSGGAWTWGSEVEVDANHYWQVFNEGSLRVVWDGTRAVIGGMVFNGSAYRVRVYDSTDFITFTNRVTSDIGTSMYSTSMAVDMYTGDVYLFGNGHNGSNYADVAYYKATRSGATLTLGSRTTAEAINGPTSVPMRINTLSEAGSIKWLYTTAASSPYTIKYGSFSIAETVSGYDTTSKLVVNGNLEASSITINGIALTSLGGGSGGSSQWLQASSDIYFATGKVGVGTNAPTAQLHVSGSTASTALLKVTDGTATAVDVLTIADEGATLFKNRTNSSAAFDIQNAAGSTLFNVNSTSGQVSVGVATGQKLINIPTSVLNTATTVTTSTNVNATGYSNQKKLATLSTGRQVVVVGTSTTNGKFMYSDSGASWTDYSADIAGWGDGSIDEVMIGSIEYLVAVWKQNGTGGGRVSGNQYIMVGSFNAGRTTLTWDTANAKSFNSAADYPDLVVMPEGSGAQAWIVESEVTASSQTIVRYSVINGSGVPGAVTLSTTIGAGGAAVATWPSIDYDPTTKRLFVASSAGTTGAGKGIRYKTASYASGNWTWSSDIGLDDNLYAQTENYWVNSRWDGNRIVIGAFGWTGSQRPIKLYEADSSSSYTSFTTRTYVIDGGEAYNGSMAIDPLSDDVYIFRTGGTIPRQIRYTRFNRSTATFESTVMLETSVGDPIYVMAAYTNNAIAWVYTHGSGSPYTIKYNSLTLANTGNDTTSKLVVNGNIEASSFTINGVALGATLGSHWLQDTGNLYYSSGKISIGAGNVPTAQLHVSGSTASTALLKVTDGTATAVDVLTIADEGATTFRNRTNSSAAFDVQNAAGSTIFNVDSTNQRVSIGVASGQKEITIYTGEAPTTPVTITSLANSSTATQFNVNQKKIVTLSTGRIVTAITDSNQVEGELWYSDDGSTWTKYASDIAGWADGSITAYVDSGGTERLVAVWDQSGTGGSRVSGMNYLAVGTFNAARTTITWSTAVSNSVSDGNYRRGDVVVHTDGTGGMAHWVLNYGPAAGGNGIYHWRVSIDSSGVPAAPTYVNQFGSQAAGNGTYPSLAINPSTKDLYLSWSEDTNGSGNGIRYAKATHSAGSWTWSGETELSSVYFVNANSGLRTHYDAVRNVVLIAGSDLEDGLGGRAVGLWERDAANSTTTTHFTTAVNNDVRTARGSSVLNSSTGDLYFIGTRFTSVWEDLYYRKITRSGSSMTLGAHTLLVDAADQNWAAAGATPNGVSWIFTANSSSPYNIRYGSISFAAATTGYDTTSKLVVNGNIEASSFTVNGVALSSVLGASQWSQVGNNIFYTLGSVSVGTATATARLHVSSGEVGTALLKVTDATGSSTDVLSIADGGATTFKPQTNSTNTFDIQNAAGSTIFNVDSSNQRVQIGVASGQKSITVYTGEAATTPTTIYAGSSATSTAYSNQKKTVVLSTGRMVTVVGPLNSGATSTFWYSDDGTSWTDYSADIAGWSNGSIYSYVDAGGIERLVATWKQSGTGGGRTNNALYFAVGTFNTARTTLSWSIQSSAYSADPSGDDSPDIVAHAEGTGGMAHIVWSYSNDGRAIYDTYTIDSSGVATYGSRATLGGAYSTTVGSYPSITYDPLTKRLLVAWSSGTTGASRGIRFRTATYSAGSWTWASERDVDISYYVGTSTDASRGYSTIQARWDGTAAYVSGTWWSGSAWHMKVIESTDFFATAGTARVDITYSGAGGQGFGSSLAVHPSTRDLYLVYSIDNGSLPGDSVGYYKWTRATTTLQTYVQTDNTQSHSSTFLHGVNAMYANNAIRWVYSTGNANPTTVRYGSLVFNAPTTGLDTTSKLVVNGNIEASSITINGISLGSSMSNQWLQAGNNVFYSLGSVSVGTGTATARLHVASGEVGVALLKVTDSTGSGTDVLTIADGGATTFKNQTNSSAAFDVQNAAGSTLFNVNSTSGQVSVGVASGAKTINIPSSVVGTASTVTTSSSASTANVTAYPTQRKLTRLSTGRYVAVVGTSTTNGKLLYSDSGSTWTDYSADIAGWANGSISSYVDTAGNERIIAAWKQSGTGGGRTDTFQYIMVGTFNAARTTITWGTALMYGNDATDTYPDLVSHAEGTGGRAHLVFSRSGGGPNNAMYYRGFSVDVSGNIVTVDAPTLFSFTGTSVHTFPSIDYDPATKRLFIAYSGGGTGAGLGIRFRTASYSGGVWTWASDVEIDTTRYVENVTSGWWQIVRWDATASRVVIMGMVRNGSAADILIRDSTNFTSFTTIASQTSLGASAQLNYGGGAIDPLNGDVWLFGGNGSNDIAYLKWSRAQSSWSSRTVFASPSNGVPYINAVLLDKTIGLLYSTGASSPYTVKYQGVTLATTGVDTTSKLVVNGNLEASSITINGVAFNASGNSYWLQNGSDIYYTSGKVGIGTSTPGGDLAVVNATSGQTSFQLQNTATGGRDFRLFSTNDGNAIAGGMFAIYDNSTGGTAGYRLVVDSTGRIGIGDSTPEAKLDVVQNADSDNDIGLSVTAGVGTERAIIDIVNPSYNGRLSVTDTYLALGTSASQDQLVVRSGNIGIATSDPVSRLEVEDGNTSASVILKVTADDANPYGIVIGNDSFSTTDTHGLQMWVTDDGTGKIQARGSGNENLILQQDGGNVGIGITDPGSSKLYVNGAATLMGSVGIGTASPSTYLAGTVGATIFHGTTPGLSFGTTSNGYWLQYMPGDTSFRWYNSATGDRLAITAAGNLRLYAYGAGTLVTDSSGNVTASSDERLKDVQGSFGRGLADILNIDPILYKWNGLSGMETDGTYAGFSAQNVQLAIPEATSTDSRGYLTLQDRPILAATVNAIKEVNASIQGLDARIAALENAIGTTPDLTSLNVTGPTTLSNLTVSGNVAIGGKLTVASAEITGTLTVGGHIIASGDAPTIEQNANLGVLAATVEIDGTDTAGTITLVAGEDTVKGVLAKVTFNQNYLAAPRIIVTATNEDGVSLPVYVNKVADGFEIVTTVNPVAGKTYQFDYVIIGAQASN